MSNSLNENIEGKIVLLEDGKAVYCESGFGCYDFTVGSALCGVTVPDEQTIKTSGHSVVRIDPTLPKSPSRSWVNRTQFLVV